MMRFLAALLALIAPPAIYFPLRQPQLEARQRASDNELRELEVRVEQGHAATRKLDQFHLEVDRLKIEREKLRRIMPAEMNIQEIRGICEKAAADNGVRLTRFDFDGGDRTTAEVVGPSPATAGFMQQLSNAWRIIDVTSVTMRPHPAGWRTGFVMTTYAMRDAPEGREEGRGAGAGAAARSR